MHEDALRMMRYKGNLQRDTTEVDLRGRSTFLPGDSHAGQACTTRPQ